MWYFPWTTETFSSPLAPADVAKYLAAHTGPPITWGNFLQRRPDTFFRGRVGGERFDICRNIRGRNSMLPVIEGQVNAIKDGSGSTIRINHRLHLFTFIVAGGWLIFASVMAGNVVLGGFGSRGFHLLDVLFPAPLILGLLFFIYPFWLEVGKSRPHLMKLLILTPLKSS